MAAALPARKADPRLSKRCGVSRWLRRGWAGRLRKAPPGQGAPAHRRARVSPRVRLQPGRTRVRCQLETRGARHWARRAGRGHRSPAAGQLAHPLLHACPSAPERQRGWGGVERGGRDHQVISAMSPRPSPVATAIPQQSVPTTEFDRFHQVPVPWLGTGRSSRWHARAGPGIAPPGPSWAAPGVCPLRGRGVAGRAGSP